MPSSPTPPAGPTTYTSLGAMIIGVVLAVLSLFDVVPTDEDVQALGVIVGAVLVVVPYVVSAISRTKQATNLAKLAQAERLAARPTLADKIERVTVTAEPASGPRTGKFYSIEGDERVYSDGSRESTAGVASAGPATPERSYDARAEVLGAPVDLSREIQNGSVRPPGVDVGGEAPLTDEAVAADEPGVSDEVRP